MAQGVVGGLKAETETAPQAKEALLPRESTRGLRAMEVVGEKQKGGGACVWLFPFLGAKGKGGGKEGVMVNKRQVYCGVYIRHPRPRLAPLKCRRFESYVLPFDNTPRRQREREREIAERRPLDTRRS